MGAPATSAVASLEEYRNRVASLPAEAFVGSLVWFSIMGAPTWVDGKRVSGAVKVSPEDLEKWFDELDLDKSFLPPRIKRVDAFRRASSEVTREFAVTSQVEWIGKCTKCSVEYSLGERKPTTEFICPDDKADLKISERSGDVDGVTAILMVREVTYDEERVVRWIVKEVRNRRTQKLLYEPHMATLKFYRGDKKTRGTARSGEKWRGSVLPSVGDEDRKVADDMIAEIRAKYDTLCEYYHADAIRAMIRNYVIHLNAISVKSNGGVYFVHNTRLETMFKLKELVERIGQGCVFHPVPLVDTPDQRKMLTAAFEDEVEDDVRLLLKEVVGVNERSAAKGGGIDPKKYAEIRAKFEHIRDSSAEYADLLGLAQSRAAAALEMAMDAVDDLAERLDVS